MEEKTREFLLEHFSPGLSFFVYKGEVNWFSSSVPILTSCQSG